MRLLLIVIVIISVTGVYGQSGRVAPTGLSPTPAETLVPTISIKQMFDEVNGYIRAKATEFDAKKIAFSDNLFKQTKLEQRQMAAKSAAMAARRKDLSTDDQYYLGMLHWIAENLDGTLDALQKFVSSESPDPARRQTARSVLIVVLAKQKKMDEAEAMFAEYLKSEPTKFTERSRIGGEMAKAYQALRDFTKMAPHADAGYNSSKKLLQDASSRARGLDEILDAGMLVFEAYRDSGDQKKADDALEDMRLTAAETEAPSFYYYAVDQKIRYMIETGRKPAAMDYYLVSLINAGKDFRVKTSSADVIERLKKREKHYKLLGGPPPELLAVDQWFPGTPKNLAAYKGKVVLLDFWATWCTPCFEAFPSLIEWHQDFNREGLEILGITRYYGTVSGLPADEKSETLSLKQFREKERLPYDFVVMKDQSSQNLYGATALPTAVLIDRKGVVRYIEAGTSSARLAQLREMLLKLLAEK